MRVLEPSYELLLFGRLERGETLLVDGGDCGQGPSSGRMEAPERETQIVMW
jgi:hypothetical protein